MAFNATIKSLLISIAVCTNMSANAIVDGQDQQARDITNYTLSVLNESIDKYSSSSLKQLVKSTKVNIDDGVIPNAYSYRAGNTPHIAISRQLVLLFYYMSELNTLNLQQQGTLSPCLMEYSAAVRQQYAKIVEAFSKGANGTPIMAPEDYAETSITCAKLTELYPFPENLKAYRNQEVVSAIGFVYLHEVGHLARGHSPEVSVDFELYPSELLKQKAFLQYMCRSRQQEFEADAFSADTLVDLGFPLSATSVSLWQTFTATSGLDPFTEMISTHPNGYTRYVRVADRVLNRTTAKGLSLPNGMKEVIGEMKTLLKKISDKLPIEPLPDGTQFTCQQDV